MDTPIDGVDFEYIAGKRSTSKLLWLPDEKQFYKKHTEYKSSISYRCYQMGCRARATVVMEAICVRNSEPHLHGDASVLHAELTARNELRARVAEDDITELRSLYNGVMASHRNISLKYGAIRRSLQRKRASAALSQPIDPLLLDCERDSAEAGCSSSKVRQLSPSSSIIDLTDE
ncbi:uncharacterized protein LOC131681891 [Topomyia yanbarensis]|uniref:uncharacterized protein LOC131681891 n=1 Tax=Topomyia yanbarensis TaxID=2498891 RepID=UPI00273B70AB|nr:uncharacterized protein LOC131681891 [Topomyia yanbarensis]